MTIRRVSPEQPHPLHSFLCRDSGCTPLQRRGRKYVRRAERSVADWILMSLFFLPPFFPTLWESPIDNRISIRFAPKEHPYMRANGWRGILTAEHFFIYISYGVHPYLYIFACQSAIYRVRGNMVISPLLRCRNLRDPCYPDPILTCTCLFRASRRAGMGSAAMKGFTESLVVWPCRRRLVVPSPGRVAVWP